LAQSKAEDECDSALQAVQNILTGVTQLDLKTLSRQIMTPEAYDEAVRTLPSTAIVARSDTIQELKDGNKRQTLQHIVRIGDPLVQGILSVIKAGQPDPKGVFKLLCEISTWFKETLKGAAPQDPLDHPVCQQLRKGIASAIRQGQINIATQLLSVASSGPFTSGGYCAGQHGIGDRIE